MSEYSWVLKWVQSGAHALSINWRPLCVGTFFHRHNLETSFESLTQNHWCDRSNTSLRRVFEKDPLSGIPAGNLPKRSHITFEKISLFNIRIYSVKINAFLFHGSPSWMRSSLQLLTSKAKINVDCVPGYSCGSRTYGTHLCCGLTLSPSPAWGPASPVSLQIQANWQTLHGVLSSVERRGCGAQTPSARTCGHRSKTHHGFAELFIFWFGAGTVHLSRVFPPDMLPAWARGMRDMGLVTFKPGSRPLLHLPGWPQWAETSWASHKACSD